MILLMSWMYHRLIHYPEQAKRGHQMHVQNWWSRSIWKLFELGPDDCDTAIRVQLPTPTSLAMVQKESEDN